MKDHPGGGILRTWMLACAAAVLAALGSPLAAVEYGHDNVRIAGQQIFSFSDGGTPVTVIVDGFELTLGDRTVRGREAVIWIETHSSDGTEQHDVTLYVEGEAEVVEPGGTTTDKRLLVTLHTDGQIRTPRAVVQRDLTNFPLYQRAVEARKQSESPTVVATPPVAAPASVAPAPAVTEPPGEPPVRVVMSPTDLPPPPSAPAPASAQAVDFHYDELSSRQQEIGLDRAPMRATVLRGHVRITSGDPDSLMYLELRSDCAVVFTRKATDADRAPGQRRFIGGLGMDTSGGQEVIEGVYLDGDVVISCGERTFRGPTAYYDFGTDRAIILDAVFHSVQEQRNIPVYIRAKEARILSAREIYFRNAKVSTSEFYRPSYHIGATRAYMMDTSPYDEATGQRLGPRSLQARMKNVTYNVGGVPVFYWPYEKTDFTEGHTALRKASVGHGRFGWGAETQWDLFRLLGLVRPSGFRGRLDVDIYEKAQMVGVDVEYARRNYSGYWLAHGVVGSKDDKFGTERDSIAAPSERGRLLLRHKQLLPGDWELQAEASWISDRNFMEAYFPAEHFSGKEQETLLYAKKQQDNWALTGLLQYRLNRFETQTESWPEVAGYLIGEPLLNDRLTYFGEARAGVKHWQPDRDLDVDDSDTMVRMDTRQEVDMPLHLGPVNLVSYATGRATYWGDSPSDDDKSRPYGQIGQRANMHIWRVYDNVSSRVWDLNGLKHIITPEATVFASGTGGVDPNDLYAMDAAIEDHLTRMSGASFGVYQRLQTKRFRKGEMQVVDWMRINLTAGFFSEDGAEERTSGGDFYWYRPEYSLARNYVNGEYDWQISDSTALLGDFNADVDTGTLAQASLGLAVSRDPRLRYYVGWRYLKDLSSSLATFGVNYQLSRKYSISFFEQYDMEYDGGRNIVTNISIIRQLPRWYAGLTITYIGGQEDGNNVGLMLTFWPEGIPEATLGLKATSLLGKSDKN